MSLLSVRNLRKSFRSGPEALEVLRDVSFDLSKGETAVIGGESGSGKSTLLNLIAGLETISDGDIHFDGLSLRDLDEERLSKFRSLRIGLVFQFHYLLKDFTALENVFLPAFLAGKRRAAAEERARRLLVEVGLAPRLTHYPSELSGGERQRTAIARALVNDPDLILADEPTGNLDEGNSRSVENLLLSLAAEHAKSLLIVTHDRDLLRRGNARFSLSKGVLTRED